MNSAYRVAPSSACWMTSSVHSSPSDTEHAADGVGLGPRHYRPIAAAAESASCHRRSSDPVAQVEWVPLETRSGSASLHTGPSATRAASNTRQYEASAFMSVVSVTR